MGKKDKQHSRYFKWFQNNTIRASISFVVFVCIYAVSMYIPIVGGFTAYPVVIVKCSKLPVVTTDIMGARIYTESGERGYGKGMVLSTIKTYMCTPQEAGERGYRRAID